MKARGGVRPGGLGDASSAALGEAATQLVDPRAGLRVTGHAGGLAGELASLWAAGEAGDLSDDGHGRPLPTGNGLDTHARQALSGPWRSRRLGGADDR